MTDAVAHCVHHRPWNLIMMRSKSSIYALDVVCGLTNDFDISDYGILYQLVGKKSSFIHIGGISIYSLDRI
jgi:hypothetical protein